MVKPINDNSNTQRLICLDYIRIFSCLCVLLVHFNAKVSGYNNGLFIYPNSIIPNYYLDNRVYLGRIGVSLFFMLSGAAQMLSYKSGNGFRNVCLYYKKRFLGLFPMFWIAFVIATSIDFLIQKSLPQANPLFLGYSFVGMDGYMSIMGFPGGAFYKLGEWFLGCILLLYIVFPLLHYGVTKIPVITSALVLGIYVVFAPNVVFQYGTWFEFYLMLPEILFGMLFIKHKLWEGSKALWMFAGTGLLTLIAYLLRNRIPSPTLTTIFCAFLFSIMVLLTRKIKYDPLNSTIVKFSALTYPIFLIHHRVIYRLTEGFALPNLTKINVLMLFFIYLSITIILSLLLKKAGDRLIKTRILSSKPANFLWVIVFIGIIILPTISAAKHFSTTQQLSSSVLQIDDAEIINHNTPAKVVFGETYSIDITVCNCGESEWSEENQIRLCIWQDGVDWGYRLVLPEETVVTPGEEFTFRLIGFGAPPDRNSTCLEYQMVREGIRYFGEREKAEIEILVNP